MKARGKKKKKKERKDIWMDGPLPAAHEVALPHQERDPFARLCGLVLCKWG